MPYTKSNLRFLTRFLHSLNDNKDIEKNHWEQFDTSVQFRVLEALDKVFARNKEVNDQSLMEELDMDESSWEKYGQEIMDLVIGIPAPHLRTAEFPRVLILAGVPGVLSFIYNCTGSGKSTFANKLVELYGWERVNQDEMGTRKACELKTQQALKKGRSIIIDRCNFDISQRYKHL
jgi:tRNA splicing ligase